MGEVEVKLPLPIHIHTLKYILQISHSTYGVLLILYDFRTKEVDQHSLKAQQIG